MDYEQMINMVWPKKTKTQFKKGHISWLKGKTSPFKGKHQTKESKEKISNSNKGRIAWNKDKTRLQVSSKKGKTYEEYYGLKRAKIIRKKCSLSHIGKPPGNKGKHPSKEIIEKIRFASLGRKPNIKTRKQMSQTHKQQWKDLIYREKVIKATLKGLFKRPTNLEIQYKEFFNKHNLPFAYCGDGSLLIGYKNPDFYETNGKKICVEVRSTFVCEYFWNETFKQYKEKRINHFAKWGWKCLVFNEEDLNDENKIVKSLHEVIKI